MRKGDGAKILVAAWLRKRIPMANEWIANRLSMGHHGAVSCLVVAASKSENQERELKKLTRLLQCEPPFCDRFYGAGFFIQYLEPMLVRRKPSEWGEGFGISCFWFDNRQLPKVDRYRCRGAGRCQSPSWFARFSMSAGWCCVGLDS